jgi:hypothetical protein
MPAITSTGTYVRQGHGSNRNLPRTVKEVRRQVELLDGHEQVGPRAHALVHLHLRLLRLHCLRAAAGEHRCRAHSRGRDGRRVDDLNVARGREVVEHEAAQDLLDRGHEAAHLAGRHVQRVRCCLACDSAGQSKF